MGKAGAIDSNRGSGYTAHQDLAFPSDIPELHLEGKCQADTGNQQRNRQLYGLLNGDLLAESAADHAGIYFKWIVSQQ